MDDLVSLIEIMKYNLESIEKEIKKLEKYKNNIIYIRLIILEINKIKVNLDNMNKSKIRTITDLIRIILRRLKRIKAEGEDEKIKAVIDGNLREFLVLLIKLDGKI
ncbi:hypothetical protein HYU23_02060 [Candidatus Woesearchaeota archaeon]|nr:hypothetical protein [Candidatus Woesearchaeota archaeon]